MPKTVVLSSAEFDQAVAGRPVQLWNSATAARCYPRVLSLSCLSSNGNVLGLWLSPLDEEGVARRPQRLLPYASPWIEPTLHPQVKHRVAAALLAGLLDRVPEVELPMDPQFTEVAAFFEQGVELLCRHTRLVELRQGTDRAAQYLPSTRQHLHVARASYDVRHEPRGRFAFNRAIVGQPPDTVAARTQSGRLLEERWDTLALSALDVSGTCRSQVFVVRNGNHAVLLHSWFDRTAPRGAPTLLVHEAMERSIHEWGSEVFDFEGSVLPGVDNFNAGFGAVPAGYPQLRRRAQAPPEQSMDLG